jgi:hypothetical protein
MGEPVVEEFNRASQDVAGHWPWILAAVAVSVTVSAGVWKEFLFVGVPLTIAIMIILYGRIAGGLVPDGTAGTWKILQDNWLNYLVAVVIIGLPERIMLLLVASRFHSLVGYVVLATAFGAGFGILTIYALPIVFIRKSRLAAILAGIVFLFRNPAASSWIAAVVVVTQILAVAGVTVFRVATAPWSFALVLLTGVVVTFLSLVTFAGASRVLLGDRP